MIGSEKTSVRKDESRSCNMWLPDDEARAMQIAKLFLAHGADPTIRNKDGMTAADLARKRGLEEVADLLSR